MERQVIGYGRKRIMACVLICLCQLVILFINYRHTDIHYPLSDLNGDAGGVFCYAKIFDEHSINLESPMLGGYSGFDMYDYPYSDSLSFLMVKAIGLLSDNPFVIINIFFFFCSFINAVVSFLYFEKYLRMSPISMALGLLYANTMYYQFRYGHMWLVPYFLIPVACSMAIDIIDGTLLGPEHSLFKNKSFYKAVLLSFLCAFTGMYYAYFTCALLAIACVIRCIQTKKLKGNIYPVVLILIVISGVVIQIIPSMLYWAQNGVNPNGELAIRNGSDAELYGLKLIQMVLPRVGHRIGLLSGLTGKYSSEYPLVTENMTASLGLIADIGLVAAVIRLFDSHVKKTYSYLIISVFLVATIGGLSSIISLLVQVPVRCYNRMSLIILFLSLLCFGSVLKKAVSRLPVIAISIIALFILCIGIYDQTVTVVPSDNSVIDSDREFVTEIEETVGEDAYVFELPYVQWPTEGNYRMFLGYLLSDDLHWSYGSMQGREEAAWQQTTAALPADEMVEELILKGYDGIYLDAQIYDLMRGQDASQALYNELNVLLQEEPLQCKGDTLYFWSLQNYADAESVAEMAA